MVGGWFRQGFELEVKCGSYEAEVTWEVGIAGFAIFEPISTFSAPECSKWKINGGYFYLDFEVEVKCGSCGAGVRWRSESLALPFLDRFQRFQRRGALNEKKKYIFLFTAFCVEGVEIGWGTAELVILTSK